MGHITAIKNLAYTYHEQKDNLYTAAYFIAYIGHGSVTKKQIIDHLKNTWHIDDTIIKKAYKLQKTLVPNPYKGGL